MTTLKMALTRFFVCDEGHEVEWTPSWTSTDPDRLIAALRHALKVTIAEIDLPATIGANWREMTDAEVEDYLRRKEQEERSTDTSEDDD